MSTRSNNGLHYENHQRAAELHDGAAQAHRVAEQHEQDDHLSGHEHSRLALEQSQKAYEHTDGISGQHGIAAFRHDDIAALAHELWQSRGCPEGSPEDDWFHAAAELRSRAASLRRSLRSEDQSTFSEPPELARSADKVFNRMSVRPASKR